LKGAVVITDISGYTALSAIDESMAILASALVQREARAVAEKFEGQFVKSTGDGALLHFHSAEEAMCAITQLHSNLNQSAIALQIEGIQLHSGVHWGEFLKARDGDIYGTTVNLTARIADRAKAGTIAVSDELAAQLPTARFILHSMGLQQFKNLPDSIECLQWDGPRS